ncbi:patatin-like phospholipase family protein [Bacillus paranthracis]|uniref:patatin-like phospholipase family protein n=1 Tax=Bacillus paranthracis TaxID=2026186 RepID=UPI000278FBA5|nr:patatin-like phospholipase family protein [Bacillus paranthracis]EJQ03975.1 hypothetical protein IC5_02773 [Bacillus cereus AND1407]MDG0908944.1 patatin-like phospholipase family protein [Bacillus paranthracis]MDR4347241.1 patatin-like phospholipase family protein [Bacillus paranthracis]TKC26074.1 patatin-like phospholipase family protein [Bacillus paranthracis]HDR7456228.1 patatin-like phospholipase family protein [Bacillus paranthracis]
MSKNVGLVLAGGGGKGAYHIGVWKALKEFGIEQNIGAVAGTSVGALNAALFTQGDYKIAESVWKNIKPSQILSIEATSFLEKLAHSGMANSIINPLLKRAKKIAKTGLFSRSGMIEIINKHVSLSYISNSSIKCYATCCKIPTLKETYFSLNKEDEQIITSILLASSALPLIFEPEEINGERYIDGGVKDNIPILPLYHDGYRNFIIVHLNPDEIINYEQFSDANIIEIVPRKSIGKFVNGTLDFTAKGANQRIQQGYEDTVHILKPIYEMGKVQQRTNELFSTLLQKEIQFKHKRNSLINDRNSLKDEIDQLIK